LHDLKSLLMPLGAGGEVEERLKGGLLVARELQAHLRVLHTNIDPKILLPQEVFVMSPAALKGLKDALDKHAGVETDRLKALLESICAVQGVPLLDAPDAQNPSASWLQKSGLRSALVAQYGKLADLIVMARPPEGKSTASFESAVLETGRPVLLIPRKLESFSLQTVVIGWNCTVEASRSIGSALPVLKRASNVVVATTVRAAGKQPGSQDVCEYLAVHGVSARAEVLPASKKYKGEALLQCGHDLGANMLVMGAFSKKRLQESVFGGVTQHMLARADIPLFLSH